MTEMIDKDKTERLLALPASTNAKNFGRNVRIMCEECGYKNSHLQDVLHTNLSGVFELQAGAHGVSMADAEALEAFFGVPMMTFLHGTPADCKAARRAYLADQRQKKEEVSKDATLDQNIRKTVGNNIRCLRSNLAMTMEEFGHKIGMNALTVQDIQKGKRVITQADLEMIAPVLKVSAGSLKNKTPFECIKEQTGRMDLSAKPPMVYINPELRGILREKGFKVGELSRRYGIKQNLLSDWLSGQVACQKVWVTILGSDAGYRAPRPLSAMYSDTPYTNGKPSKMPVQAPKQPPKMMSKPILTGFSDEGCEEQPRQETNITKFPNTTSDMPDSPDHLPTTRVQDDHKAVSMEPAKAIDVDVRFEDYLSSVTQSCGRSRDAVMDDLIRYGNLSDIASIEAGKRFERDIAAGVRGPLREVREKMTLDDALAWLRMREAEVGTKYR